ncbi:MAG: hypothetical protein US85_C0025G0002 [Candidatus Shapirobacteria bacterium GW2011_GWF1_38_23]|nr:MAG: hypothetical protein US85_C0025G0002 [Candidatus Shapirobacteria bacterium GW2011_GWF1_38_23]
MADYWIKIYHEILEDPKMATMPDRLWRRTIEIFLIAGKLSKDKSGILPETNQLAWLLRMNTDDLALDLKQLETAGIIKRIDNGWTVVNFEKRQAAVTGSERVQQFRKRQHNEQYYDNVTELKRNVTQNTEYRIQSQNTESETKKEITTSSDSFGQLIKEYEQNIGVITQKTSDMVSDDFDTYGYEMCSKAITEAIRQNKRNWSYVQGILKNWWTSGYNKQTKKYEPSLRRMVHPDGTIEEVMA